MIRRCFPVLLSLIRPMTVTVLMMATPVTVAQEAVAHDAVAHDEESPRDVTVTTVYLVRHAEKQRQPKLADPPLNATGRARAETLAHVLGSADLDAIYTTDLERTRATAAPLAEALGVESVEVEAEDSIEETVRLIDEQHVGDTLLVVGHSNTTPQLARALGAEGVPDILDHENDYLFVVTRVDSRAMLQILRYGLPSAAPEPAPSH